MIRWYTTLNQLDPSVAETRVSISKAKQLAAVVCAGVTGAASWPASAFEIFNGGATQIHWDNTFKYSAAFRLNDPDPALIADPNADDGDRNFRAGVISNRLDLL